MLTLSPDKRDIKIRALTTESGSSPITVEGCTETALNNYGDTVLHATGTTVILKGNITRLFCAGDTFDSNKLTALNVQGLPDLELLDCRNNNLTSLDVHGLTSLKNLDCAGNIELSVLNIQGAAALEELSFGGKITTLNVQGLPALRYLNCSNNQLNAEAMRTLLTGLPQRQASDYAECVLYNDDPDEGNHKDFTSASAAPALKQAFNKAKIEKHWRMYKRIGNNDEEI